MRIEEILSHSRVPVRLEACSREEALGVVAQSFAERHPELGCRAIYDSLWCRERLGTTGIGDGVAIPHARIAGLQETEVVVATCPDGLEFDAVDGKPVRIVVGILSPADAPKEALRALSDVVRCLKKPAVRQALERGGTPESVVDAMCGRNSCDSKAEHRKDSTAPGMAALDVSR